MLRQDCPDAESIAAFQRSNIEKRKTVGLEQMDAYNLFPVLNNYIFAFENYNSNLPSSQPIILPSAGSGQWNFPECGMLVKSTPFYYAVVGGKKGGVIRVWDKKAGILAFQSSGYLFRIGKKWYSNQAQGISSYIVNETDVKVEAPFVAINQKIFNPWLFMAFRLFTVTIGRVPALAYKIKDMLVSVLVRNKKTFRDKLSRTICFSDAMITIEDSLSDRTLKVIHLDKFSTIHMGSSRYAHMEEEQIRGGKYPRSESEFNQNGVITKTKVRFA
jgi:hypothetical protein